MQKGDFVGIFKAMDGYPVIIRLLDPPLHEFLPKEPALLEALGELKKKGAASSPEAEKLRRTLNKAYLISGLFL